MGKRIGVSGAGTCPKCKLPMQRWVHSPEWRPKATQPYYFSYWDICRPCRHFQHYEQAKVWLDPKPETEEAKRLAAIKTQLTER